MHLHDFTVCGFRSLGHIHDIPVSGPTILAGQNDGGKSAVLAALAFLVGDEQLSEDDRTYEFPATDGAVGSSGPSRCTTTWVEGRFALDAWEQDEFGLPEELRVRRYAVAGESPRLECWAPLSGDERLRDPSQWTVREVMSVSA
ncbi:ATP-binding protein [Streptomyces hirsutus]|uniref:hypothetical protein n=1 Tax=Streptomyces hirsutus TaxID=35620 RepID=UPI0036563FB0